MNHIDTMKQVRNALYDVTRLIEHQYTGTRRGMSALQRASDACYDALPGLNDLIAQAEKREPVGVMMVRVKPNGTKVCEPEFYEGKTPPPHALLYTAPPQPLNLSDKSVQKRLATQWGYVPKEQT